MMCKGNENILFIGNKRRLILIWKILIGCTIIKENNLKVVVLIKDIK